MFVHATTALLVPTAHEHIGSYYNALHASLPTASTLQRICGRVVPPAGSHAEPEASPSDISHSIGDDLSPPHHVVAHSRRGRRTRRSCFAWHVERVEPYAFDTVFQATIHANTIHFEFRSHSIIPSNSDSVLLPLCGFFTVTLRFGGAEAGSEISVCRWCRALKRHCPKRECKGEKWKSHSLHNPSTRSFPRNAKYEIRGRGQSGVHSTDRMRFEEIEGKARIVGEATNASRRRRGFGYERDTGTGKAVWLEERGAVIRSGRERPGVARHLDENDLVVLTWYEKNSITHPRGIQVPAKNLYDGRNILNSGWRESILPMP
ncbi:hypothetical protein B0H13DRAFT_2266047 [Mycena leptocephala]|nr:hypothetical protein B0H13DRAFT_2266047 [Mycena leptocephala]